MKLTRRNLFKKTALTAGALVAGKTLADIPHKRQISLKPIEPEEFVKTNELIDALNSEFKKSNLIITASDKEVELTDMDDFGFNEYLDK